MSLQQPDPDVLRRARHGDERAFETIVQMYQTPLFNYVARVLGGDRALAEDICQEVFIRVHRSLARFDHRCLFTTWLFQVAKHRVVDELRARERRGKPTLELGAVWQAVGTLNSDLRMALLLRDVIGLSYSEIAEALDTTLATVKWRIFKARELVVAELIREGARRPGDARTTAG